MNIIFTHTSLGQNGRFGNQLFQIAATMGIAESQHGSEHLPKWEYNQYFKKPLRDLGPGIRIHANYKELRFAFTEFIFSDAILQNTPELGEIVVIDLHGYFQSEKYWQHCKEKVLKQFKFNDEVKFRCQAILKQIEYSNPGKELVSIHFRFGDYVKLQETNFYVDLLKTNYYLDAILNSSANSVFVVFSDDREEAEKAMVKLKAQINIDYVVVSFTNEIEDLCMMSLLNHHIIANSSFSWWGAYLSKDEDIIAPKQWFGERAGIDAKDLYTENMILI